MTRMLFARIMMCVGSVSLYSIGIGQNNFEFLYIHQLCVTLLGGDDSDTTGEAGNI